MKWLDRTLFLAPAYALCTDEKEFARELKKLKANPAEHPFLSDSFARVHFFERNEDHDHCLIVCIRKNADYTVPYIAGLLAHEAMHIWQFTKDKINEEDPSAEFEAYAIQNIVHNLVEAYYDKGVKKK